MPERVEKPVKGEEPGMGGDSTRANEPVHRLRAWLVPSPPLAVDDEPTWAPLPDPEGDEGLEAEAGRPAAPPVAP
jgi:hypothetical protein